MAALVSKLGNTMLLSASGKRVVCRGQSVMTLPGFFQSQRHLTTSVCCRQFRLSLGTMDFGRLVNHEQGHMILRRFLELGYRDVDTATMYGESERILGTYPECRDLSKVDLATKANPSKDVSRFGVVKQLNGSLERLGVAHVDTFYLHWPDKVVPIEETLQGVNQLYQEGKFKEFGLSNFKSWEVVEVCHLCKANGFVMPTVYQGMYNAVTRLVEHELLPALRKYGLRFYAYNPLAGGILTGKYHFRDAFDKKPEGRFFGKEGTFWFETYLKRYWRKELFDAIEKVQETVKHHYGGQSVTLAEAAMRWLRHHSHLQETDGILVGVSRLPQLEPNIKAIEAGPLHQDVVDAFATAWDSVSCQVEQYFR